MKKGIFALASGTFALGMSEYVMMSILLDLAQEFQVTVTEAAHLISAYALGVCVGAPIIAITCRNWPLKRILIMLMCFYAFGNLMFALSPNFTTGIIARFISGLPHGAYFGTGTIVASRLMPDKKATGVSLMVLGMTIANLAGIPIGSYIANNFDWRWIFYFNTAIGIFTLFSIKILVKPIAPLSFTRVKESFRFMKNRAPWILTLATLLCQGGGFAMYSYVSPIMYNAGLAETQMPLFMIMIGAGMCIGNYLGGYLSDRLNPIIVARGVAIVMTSALLLTFFDTFSLWLSGIGVFIIATALFTQSSPMQLLLVEYSPGGQLMGGAMVQIAFNFGNAVGAFAGGLPISAGFQPQSAALVGSAFAFTAIWVINYMRIIAKKQT